MKHLRKPRVSRFAYAAAATLATACAAIAQAPIEDSADSSGGASAPERPAEVIRFATFNAALSGRTADDLPRRLATSDDAKLKKIAAIIQHVRPDVLLINEFDHDPSGQLATDFQTNYLDIAQGDAKPIAFAHTYSPPVNTGLPTGLDLNGDGKIGGPADAHGWGDFPGQYGMLLLSRLDEPPNIVDSAREMVWIDPRIFDPDTGVFPPEAKGVLHGSSKTHETVRVAHRGDKPIYVLISHPTPPVFDGPEDRNGLRNASEILMLVAMLGEVHSGFAGIKPKHPSGPVVILGDLNADPNDGESRPLAIDQLRLDPRIQDPQPRSRGAVEKALADGGNNAQHQTDSALDTADWHDHGPNGSGNLRVDYVLPTKDWRVVDAGVFWPAANEPGHDLIDASDHRLVWVDLTLDAE